MMKKIILGSILTMINLSAWSACTYNFDARNQDLGINPDVQIGGLFPEISGSKVSYKTQLGNYAYAAYSKTILNKIINTHVSANGLFDGDKNLTDSGIKAFEFEIKLPEIKNQETILNIFPIFIVGRMENGNYLVLNPTYQKMGETNEFIISGYHSGDLKFFDPIKIEPQKTINSNQNIAMYLNQNTQQLGLIANGINKGYIFSYPSKLKNIYFGIGSNYTGITSSDINKELSIELITDSAKLKNNYPTGTTDICGTKI